MANEKILNEEVIDEDALENVAGGTHEEGLDDARTLRKMCIYNWRDNFDSEKMTNIIEHLDKKVGLDLDIKYTYNEGNDANEYSIGGKKFTREQFWAVIDSLYTIG